MNIKISYLFLFLPQMVFCLYMGSPSSMQKSDGLWMKEDSWFSVKACYQADLLLDKSLKPTNHTIKSLENMTYTLQEGGVKWGLFDRFEFFALLGAQKFDFDVLVNPTLKQNMKTAQDFSWTVGFQALIYEIKAFSLSLGLEYGAAHPSLSYISQNGAPFKSSQGAKIHYQQWQFNVATCYTTDFISPYIGYCYSHPIVHFKNFSKGYLPYDKKHFTVKGRKKSGGAVGIVLGNNKACSLTLESRFIDETAFTGEFSLTF